MKQKINLKERYKSYMSIINFFSTLIDFLSYFTDFFEKLNRIWLISIIMTFILLIFFINRYGATLNIDFSDIFKEIVEGSIK